MKISPTHPELHIQSIEQLHKFIGFEKLIDLIDQFTAHVRTAPMTTHESVLKEQLSGLVSNVCSVGVEMGVITDIFKESKNIARETIATEQKIIQAERNEAKRLQLHNAAITLVDLELNALVEPAIPTRNLQAAINRKQEEILFKHPGQFIPGSVPARPVVRDRYQHALLELGFLLVKLKKTRHDINLSHKSDPHPCQSSSPVPSVAPGAACTQPPQPDQLIRARPIPDILIPTAQLDGSNKKAKLDLQKRNKVIREEASRLAKVRAEVTRDREDKQAQLVELMLEVAKHELVAAKKSIEVMDLIIEQSKRFPQPMNINQAD